MMTAKNVLGGDLQPCSMEPKTGFFRDGCCRTHRSDHGAHVVCAVMTDEFLRFSKASGNDLSTPQPDADFPGLKAGDRWCLCADRWKEAYEAGAAPKIILASTERSALLYASLDVLVQHAADEALPAVVEAN